MYFDQIIAIIKQLCLNTNMPKAKKTGEADSAYFLKILLYFIVGMIWVYRGISPLFPVGLVMGVLFARHEHFQIDRKMEYIILILSAFLGLIGHGLRINLVI